MRNKYPGYCYKCGKFVEKGKGHWNRFLKRVQCAIHPIEEKVPEDLENWKEKESEYEQKKHTV